MEHQAPNVDPAPSPNDGSPESQTAASASPLLHEATGTGPPVVLVPGTLTGWQSWGAMPERLALHHAVIRVQPRVVELVEAGRPIPETHRVEDERDALLATLDSLQLDRVDMVGWSLGGAMALALAMDHPERIRTLTLIEPPAFWILRQLGQADSQLAQMEAADRALSGKEITVDDLKTFLVRAGVVPPEADVEAHPRWSLMVRNRQSLASNAMDWDHVDSIERLRALAMPILAVRGTAPSTPLGNVAVAIAEVAPRGELLELPGGHACHLQFVDDFLAALDVHLDRDHQI